MATETPSAEELPQAETVALALVPAQRATTADDFLLPRQRTRAALPPRQHVLGRLGDTLGAMASRDRPLPQGPVLPMAPVPGTYVAPAQLTVLRRPGALARGRERWRVGSYGRQLDRLI